MLVGGELDLRSGEDLVRAADVLAAAGVAHVDLDLGDVSFLDTAGWHAVAEARRRVKGAGVICELVRTSPAVDRLIALLRPGCGVRGSTLPATAG
jgi:anti-anti-sigma factor